LQQSPVEALHQLDVATSVTRQRLTSTVDEPALPLEEALKTMRERVTKFNVRRIVSYGHTYQPGCPYHVSPHYPPGKKVME
jgi:hypothetical protein